MNAAIAWVKSNIVIVVLGVVMIAAVVSLPLYASSQNKKVQAKVQARYSKLSELQKLDKTSFENPVTGEVHQIAVNEAQIRLYEDAVKFKRADGELVTSEALNFNRNGHELIQPANWSPQYGAWLFPAPPQTNEAEVRPKQFSELLTQAYISLLEEINAGSPPDPVALQADVMEKQDQFKLHTLSKTADEAINPEDQAKLTEQLRGYRLSRYEENARSMSIYAELSALPVPQWKQQIIPSLAELFTWQWNYWIVSDVLRAFASANSSGGTVLDAPVKRLLSLNIIPAPSAKSGEASGAGGSAFGASGGMAGSTGSRRPLDGGGADGGGDGMENTGGGGQAINPNLPAPTDFSTSFTGRTSNHLYDVIFVQVSIVVDTTALPKIIDHLALQNFITVLNMSIEPADPFQDLSQGYLYGSPTLSRVNMVLETIWLRQWTSENMPDELKRSLGIAARVNPTGAGEQSQE